MTPSPHDRIVLYLGIVAGAVILAILALLASGSFAAPRAAAVTRAASHSLTRPQLGAPHAVAAVVDGLVPSAPARADSWEPIARGVPTPTGAVGSALLGGWATYFDTCAGCAAAGPALREALGSDWRGADLAVCTPVACVDIVLTDFCACGERHGKPTLIDLDRESFARLAPVSDGIVAVSIELPIELPRTDTDLRMFDEVRDDAVYRSVP